MLDAVLSCAVLLCMYVCMLHVCIVNSLLGFNCTTLLISPTSTLTALFGAPSFLGAVVGPTSTLNLYANSTQQPIAVNVTKLGSDNLSLSGIALTSEGNIQVTQYLDVASATSNSILQRLGGSTTFGWLRFGDDSRLSVESRGGSIALGPVSGVGALRVLAQTTQGSLALSTNFVGPQVNLTLRGIAPVVWTASGMLGPSVLGM
jgi:hypothetical protein